MIATLTIGRQSAGFVERGHPWIRKDRFTKGLERLRSGELVTLVDAQGRELALALADPDHDICARVCARPGRGWDPRHAVERALAKRAHLHGDAATDCYRLVHGEADDLPGFRIERWADVLIVEVRAACAVPWCDAVCSAVQSAFPAAAIVVKEHTDDMQRRAVASRWWSGTPTPTVIGRELGCSYAISTDQGLATGLYVDQRATRVWLRSRVAGKSVLNLFAYTGAFSVACLKAGAASATDVDLSAPALATARANAERNGVADRQRCQHGDCAAWLRASREQFDVVICDPPTAARGSSGWVARRDYPELLTLIMRRLAPGGLLVACSNTVGAPYALREAVASAGLNTLEAPRLGEDIPQRRGFPEGQPYRLAAGIRSA